MMAVVKIRDWGLGIWDKRRDIANRREKAQRGKKSALCSMRSLARVAPCPQKVAGGISPFRQKGPTMVHKPPRSQILEPSWIGPGSSQVHPGCFLGASWVPSGLLLGPKTSTNTGDSRCLNREENISDQNAKLGDGLGVRRPKLGGPFAPSASAKGKPRAESLSTGPLIVRVRFGFDRRRTSRRGLTATSKCCTCP